ncbi:MAG TPA: hypothetical protein DEV81_01565 [Cyanobacteria bacterium UBA11049]|nr:hypothetical protein [Cyanobacteria bacterium UBA11049]
MIISDLEHFEDVTTQTSLVGDKISGGLSSLSNLDEINKIRAAYKLPSLTLGSNNLLYAAGAVSANTYTLGNTTYTLSSGSGDKYQVSSSRRSSVAY